MRAARRTRWALSFADLCLLLLGFFVLLQTQREHGRKHVLSSLNEYFGGWKSEGAAQIDAAMPATDLFVPHEAMLTPTGRARITALARQARISSGAVRISSHGTDAGTARFDAWDLASARLGAVARALSQAGVTPGKIRITGPESDALQTGGPQILMVRAEP
jgi:hypothetical protein